MGTRSDREIARQVQQRLCDTEDGPIEVGEYSVYPHSGQGSGLVSRVAQTSQTVLGISGDSTVTQYIDPENGAIILVPDDGDEQ